MTRTTASIAFLLLGCSAPYEPDAAPDGQLEFLHESVTSVVEQSPDAVRLGLELSARYFVIERGESPEPDRLIAFARAAAASGRRVWITVLDRGLGSKAELGTAEGPRGRSPLVVRLADEPDPRAPRDDRR